MQVENSAKELIAKNGTNINLGARSLRRMVQNLIEDKIADEILRGNCLEKSRIMISAEEGEIQVKAI